MHIYYTYNKKVTPTDTNLLAARRLRGAAINGVWRTLNIFVNKLDHTLSAYYWMFTQ